MSRVLKGVEGTKRTGIMYVCGRKEEGLKCRRGIYLFVPKSGPSTIRTLEIEACAGI